MKPFGSIAACLVTLAAAPALAADYWEAQADNVVVMATQGGERAAELAADFVRLEQAFAQLAGTYTVPKKPLIVFAITEADQRKYVLTKNDRRDLRAFDPSSVVRYFPLQTGNVVVFSGHKGETSPLQSAYQAHAKWLASATFPATFPAWYPVGVGGLFGDVRIAAGKVHIGHDRVVVAQLRGTDDRYLDLTEALEIAPVIDANPKRLLTFQLYSRAMMQYALIERPEQRPTIEAMALDGSRAAVVSRLGEPAFKALDEELSTLVRRRNWKSASLEVPEPAKSNPPKQMADEAVAARLAQVQQIAAKFDP